MTYLQTNTRVDPTNKRIANFTIAFQIIIIVLITFTYRLIIDMSFEFFQKNGTKPAKKDIQIQSIDEDLRNGLWNLIYRNYFEPYMNKHLQAWIHFELFKRVWDELLKLRLNELRSYRSLVEFRFLVVEPTFNAMKWDEVYDLIEYLAQNTKDEFLKSKFKLECNKVLEREFSAYHFIGEKICQITSKEEKNEIEKQCIHH